MPAVPLDIVEVVFDILAFDDEEFTSLKACSLICRAFLPLCRKHIFASIKIDAPYDHLSEPHQFPYIYLFRNLLTTTPEIADYIRELHFGIRYGDEQYFIGLAEILKGCTRLSSLTLFHRYGKVDWKSLPLPVADALLCLINLPTLTSLELGGMQNFPISVLTPCIQLRHFRIEGLDNAEIDDTPPEAALLSVSSIRLEGYTFGFRSGIGTKKILEANRLDGQPLFDFTDLREFSGDCETIEDMNVALSILRRNHHLTAIHLSIDELSFFGLAGTIAPSMKTLKKLTLENIIDDEHADPFGDLCDELEEIVGKTVLEDLELSVRIMPECRKAGDGWGKLDKVLRKSGWSALKKVSLDIFAIYNYGPFDDHCDDDLERVLRTLPQIQFPFLSSSKTVDFYFDVIKVIM
ncbi:hypothetical protein BDZ97DRAFT_1915577 [Flammula alnicola]|nr:hypothetical protein BDZ97DRAFT_1915577 [Flammula alnicola]